MRIGKLDKRITIQRFTSAQDEDSGEEVKGWADLFTVWAFKRQQSGREAIRSEQVVASNVTVFQIRFKDIRPKDRVLCEGLTYEIKSTNELGRKQGLELITENKDNG